MHYLVTGGCGFIGSHVCEALAQAGHRITILDDLSTGKREHAPRDCRILVGDIADPAAVKEAIEDVDGVFHLAAIASVERSRLEWRRAHAVNLGGTVNVLAAAAQQKKHPPVVYASSAAVYGATATMPLAETMAADPLTAYGADKLGSELHAKVAWRVHGLPTAGLRFFNIYGPRQDPSSPYTGVISLFLNRIQRAEPLVINGDGLQTRDFVYVADTVRHVLAAMRGLENGKVKEGVFNVCTGQRTTINGLAAAIASFGDRPVIMTHGPERIGDIRESLGDPALATAALGVHAEISLDDGLRRTLAYFQSPCAVS